MAEEPEKTDEELLQELIKQHPIETMVQFTEFSIQEKLQNNAFQIVKYKELHIKEKIQLDRLISLKEKIIGEQYDFYRFSYDKELRPQEITTYYLPKDKKILQINKIIRKQEQRVEFFNLCVESLVRQSWNMKTYLDSLKIT